LFELEIEKRNKIEIEKERKTKPQPNPAAQAHSSLSLPGRPSPHATPSARERATPPLRPSLRARPIPPQASALRSPLARPALARVVSPPRYQAGPTGQVHPLPRAGLLCSDLVALPRCSWPRSAPCARPRPTGRPPRASPPLEVSLPGPRITRIRWARSVSSAAGSHGRDLRTEHARLESRPASFNWPREPSLHLTFPCLRAQSPVPSPSPCPRDLHAGESLRRHNSSSSVITEPLRPPHRLRRSTARRFEESRRPGSLCFASSAGSVERRRRSMTRRHYTASPLNLRPW